jgi:hypothetical protein
MLSVDLLKDQIVSYSWFGDYSALYLEIGDLKEQFKKDGTKRDHPIGAITLYTGFGWRIEGPRSIIGGSESAKSNQKQLANKLIKSTITSIETIGRISELSIGFSNGVYLSTFNASKGQPDWTISFNKLGIGHLGIQRGFLHHDTRSNSY